MATDWTRPADSFGMVEGRTLDLLLAAGFWSIALGTVAFGLIPVFGGGSLAPTAAWQLVGARLLGAGLIAIAPYVGGRTAARRRSLLSVGVGVVVVLAVAAGAMQDAMDRLEEVCVSLG